MSLFQSERVPLVQDAPSQVVLPPPLGGEREATSSFWRDRFFEAGLLLSMAFYYLVGNPNIHIPGVVHGFAWQHINPLYSLPFLGLFAVLCWYRLAYALSLLPFSLPYYYVQKTVVGNVRFSLVEITLWTCVAIALVQLLVQRQRWRYWQSVRELYRRLGPFLLPLLVFLGAATLSLTIAYSPGNALRAFRQEVCDPLLYLVLALFCLRSRQDIARLLLSLFGSGLIIALLGVAQYFLVHGFHNADLRIATVYGSGNNIGLLFDYALPIGLALIFARVSWKIRLVILLLCIPFVFTLLQSDSRGSWMVGIPVALVFVGAFALRKRRLLLVVGTAFVVFCTIFLFLFHTQIINYALNGHIDQEGNSSLGKRPWLWRSAINMIVDSPWLGYGMDNWLCHYSNSYYNTCQYPDGAPPGTKNPGNEPVQPKLHVYWIKNDPATSKPTGLDREPTLSHPHNIFLHVWVSMGIFGLLAFIATLLLFYWLFARLLWHLGKTRPADYEQLRWMTVGVGAALCAALIQGQVDSSFLAQDLSFCFWTLLLALLLIRQCAALPWRMLISKHTDEKVK